MSKPVAKRVNRLQILVVCAIREINFLLILQNEAFDIIGIQIADFLPFAALNDSPNATHRKFGRRSERRPQRPKDEGSAEVGQLSVRGTSRVIDRADGRRTQGMDARNLSP